MELGQPEAFRVMQNHDRGIWDIDAHLDHGGGNQRGGMAFTEPAHDLLLLLRPELAVDQSNLVRAQTLPPLFKRLGGGLHLERLAFLHKRIDEISLASAGELLFHEPGHIRLFRTRAHGGDDFPAARWFFIQQ